MAIDNLNDSFSLDHCSKAYMNASSASDVSVKYSAFYFGFLSRDCLYMPFWSDDDIGSEGETLTEEAVPVSKYNYEQLQARGQLLI